MMHRITILALALGFMLAIGLAAAQDGGLVNVEESLTLRAEASKTAKSITKLSRFQPVQIIERKNGEWAKVKTRTGETGWVLATYLTPTPFVSVEPDKTNVRQGWGTEYPVLMEYGQNFPLWVIETAPNGWLKVSDYEGDRSWISPKMVKVKPAYVITMRDKNNIRAGAGVESAVVFTAPKGFLLEVLAEKDGWLNVKAPDGDQGWLSAKIVFGWLTPESEPAPAEEKVSKKTEEEEKPAPKKRSTRRSRRKSE